MFRHRGLKYATLHTALQGEESNGHLMHPSCKWGHLGRGGHGVTQIAKPLPRCSVRTVLCVAENQWVDVDVATFLGVVKPGELASRELHVFS